MSERVDHVDKAREWLSYITPDSKLEPTKVASVVAQAEATLAVLEQLRIANLIALANSAHQVLDEQATKDAVNALVEFREHDDHIIGGWHELRPDVAAALGAEAANHE